MSFAIEFKLWPCFSFIVTLHSSLIIITLLTSCFQDAAAEESTPLLGYDVQPFNTVSLIDSFVVNLYSATVLKLALQLAPF